MTIDIPGTISDVAMGGGGRYLLLTLAKQRKLVAFDLNSPQQMKIVSLASETALVAAGELRDDDYVVVFHPRDREVQLFLSRVASGHAPKKAVPASP